MSTNKYIRAIKKEIDKKFHSSFTYAAGYDDGLRKSIEIIKEIDKKEKS